MFNIIELLFPVIFILIFIMIIFTLAKGISTWHKNNNSPRLTVSARIVAKRQNTTYHNQPNAGSDVCAHVGSGTLTGLFCTRSNSSWYCATAADALCTCCTAASH